MSAAELDAFPPAEVLRHWREVCLAVRDQADGPLWVECERIQGGLYFLAFAKEGREGRRGDAAAQYAQALSYCPEWRASPHRVHMLPYHLLER